MGGTTQALVQHAHQHLGGKAGPRPDVAITRNTRSPMTVYCAGSKCKMLELRSAAPCSPPR